MGGTPARTEGMNTRMRPSPNVDRVTPELETVLAQFTDEEIETGVIARDATTNGSTSERHTATTLHDLLATARRERSIARLLSSARETAGLSLADTAKRIGVTRSRVQQLEREGANLELNVLHRYAHAPRYDLQIVFVPRGDDTPTLRASTSQPAPTTTGTEGTDRD